MRYLAALLLIISLPAHAGMIHSYKFTAGGETGYFSYDDQGLSNVRSLGHTFKSFKFSWAGMTFDENDVVFGSLWLDSEGRIDGTLNSTFFGSRCGVGFCGTSGVDTGSWQFDVRNFAIVDGEFIYAPGTTWFSYGAGTETNGISASLYTVPEPGTLGLLIGLLALHGFQRFKRTPYSRHLSFQ